jgi:hypothetical protein
VKIPRLAQFVIYVALSYIVFKAPEVLFGLPIPGSLVLMYMFFAVLMILLVMTATEEGSRELFAPVKALVEDPRKKGIRNVVFFILPFIAMAITYGILRPGFEAPVELRSTHPAPPVTIRAFEKRFDLMSLENPLRHFEKEDPEKFRELVKEGGVVYFKNCFYCHGAKLDGKGHYAHGFNPLPLPFQGTDTIAQLQESFVFWRIAKGGPGLPKEATPWLSAMPASEHFLTEQKIWKVVLFIYDYTGNEPVEWE